MNRTCTVLQQGLTVGDREDRGEPFVHRVSIARFFLHPGAPRSTPAAPRSFTVLPGGPTVSTRFNTVHPGRAPLPGPPRFTTVVLTCQKPPERPPVHPGQSGIIPVHHGGTTVQPPVLPGSPRSMDRGEPG